MNEHEFDLAARAWLDDGPTRMSDRALLSTLEEIHATRQRRAVRPAWRPTPVGIFGRVAAAAVLVAVGLLAVDLAQRQTDRSSVGGLSPSPSVDFPDLTTTFVSPRNGFSIKHPDRVAVTPATQLWGFSEQVDDGFDLVETGLGASFEGASTGIPDGVSTDAWVDEHLSEDYVLPGGCGVRRSQQAQITIDGQSGRISECPNRIEATVVAGERLYLFTLLHTRSDARAVFDAFAATIDLTPETAVDYPGLETTFVSPTYGYSFKYHDRGALAPATEFWDPGDDQPDTIHFDDRFDGVETGSGAYFASASTQIPAGVSIDAWVDEYLTPVTAGGCGIPRSRQAGIAIDGRSGRIAECRNADGVDQTEATVAAGGRLYLFVLLSDRRDFRAYFDAWIATLDLRPEDAAVPSSAPPS